MKVKHVMYDQPETLTYHQTLVDAINIYKKNQVNCAPIVNEENQVVGILTVFRVLDAIKLGADFETRIKDVMEPTQLSVDEDTSFNEVCSLPIERLLVVNKQQELVGVLTRLELINKVYNALEITERELEVILQSIPCGIVAIDNEGKILHFNLTAQNITGIDSDFAKGKDISFIFKENGLYNMVNKGIGFHKQELGKNTVIVKSSPIIKEGKNLGTVLVIQDVSEIEAVSTELDSVKTLNKELESIITSSSDGILVVDENGNALYENKNFTTILSIENKHSFKGENITEYLNSEQKEIAKLFGNVLNKKEAVSQVVTGKNGQELIVTISPIKNSENQVTRCIFNCKDMTEINNLREEAMRNYQELKTLRALQFSDGEVVIGSSQMIKLFNQVKKIAAVDSTVLITGESGVGKEIIAKQLHINSQRSNGPFIQINCGAIPDTLLESELFGYEKGAFTGADKEGKIGMFEVANNGTILLDEIGEMPLNLQVKLLRAIQEQEIYRIGGRKPIKLNVRIIAATNKHLEEMIKEKKFREDLYYRLNVVPIKIPPLRERKEDIIPLAISFLNKFNKKYNRECKLSSETSYLLEQYSWEGNIRELMNLIERLVIMAEDNLILPSSLPENIRKELIKENKHEKLDEIITLQEAKENLEVSLIKKALDKYKSLRPASKALGISHSTLLRKARQYDIVVQE